MEEDDDFGELYADILITPASSAPSPAAAAAAAVVVPPAAASLETTVPVKPAPIPQPSPSITQTLAKASAPSAAGDEEDDDWLLGPVPPTLEDPVSNWGDDDGLPIPVSKPNLKPIPGPVVMPAVRVLEDASDRVDAVIPGISLPVAAQIRQDSEDSDSEDDLKIVLNDDSRSGQGEGRGIEDDDDDGEDFVIVTDQDQIHHHLPPPMEEQDWGDESMMLMVSAQQGSGADADRKDLGDAAKEASGVGSAGTGVGAARIGYSGHGWIPPQSHHSAYKYVRPGMAASASAAGPVGGAMGPPSQPRPPMQPGTFAGRGRGDWRPNGGRGFMNAQKGLFSGHGSAWGGSNGRAGGGGLDFTLPSHKTIFEVDIDSFDDKPWKYPGADISDFFNFGLDEDKWKDYCKHLEQFRLESTMQSRIRVYESGRSDQDYDPDLPPELAAATGHEIPTDNAMHNKANKEQADFDVQGKAPPAIWPPLTGRAIQVETGYGERLPSVDTRPFRLRDIDTVIEIELQHSFESSVTCSDSTVKRVENDAKGVYEKEDDGGGDDEICTMSDDGDPLPPQTDVDIKGRAGSSSEADVPSDAGNMSPDRHLPRPNGRQQGVSGQNSDAAISPKSATAVNHDDLLPEKLVDDADYRTSNVSPVSAVETEKEVSVEERDTAGERLELMDSIEAEAEDVVSGSVLSGDAPDDDNAVNSGKKLQHSPRVEPIMAPNNDVEDKSRTSMGDNSKGKMGSSRDIERHPDHDVEARQNRQTRKKSDVRRHEEERSSLSKFKNQKDGRLEAEKGHAAKQRDDRNYADPRRDRSNSRNVHSRTYERSNERDNWERREDSVHNRVDNVRAGQTLESGLGHSSKIRASDRSYKNDDRPRRPSENDDSRSSVKRDRGDAPLGRNENSDSLNRHRKTEQSMKRGNSDHDDMANLYLSREDSSRRKRERDDGGNHRRREENVRAGEKAQDLHYRSKQKDDILRHKGRDGAESSKKRNDNAISHHGREGSRVVRSGRDHSEQNEHSHGHNKEEYYSQKKVRADVRMHDKYVGNDDTSSRKENLVSHDTGRGVSATNKRYGERHKEKTREGKGSENVDQNSQRAAKRRHSDHDTHQKEKVDARTSSEQESSALTSKVSSKTHVPNEEGTDASQHHPPISKNGQESVEGEENAEVDLKKGRSKFERWNSHKEQDYNATHEIAKPVLSSVIGDTEIPKVDEPGKPEVNSDSGDGDHKAAGEEPINGADEQDHHADTMEKLKRRSERFKLPMRGEKEVPPSKKLSSEPPPPPTEAIGIETDVKPERPARKRRWTGT